ncbi:MAG: 50S ribosomal protein L25/general stress protein Ctc [Pseudomonadota bacterium]|nr:50S ribosomal protein L25/general stress protein Ctc [Pseudomonadota bacterium]
MSQESYVLKAERREKVGKGAARELRRNGMVPAVIYGDKKDPLPIALSRKEVTLQLHGGSFMTTLATIDVDGEHYQVLPKDYQADPIRDFLTHVDFLRIGKGSRVVVEIPVHFINEDDSPGLKRGGVLNIVRHEVEVECPATAIPDSFEIDIAGLDIGDSIHISHVKLPENVTPTITDRDFTIATIAGSSAMKSEEDEDGEEGETDADAEGESEAEGEGEE